VGGSEGVTLLFRDPEPSASAVLEEVAHALQARQNRYVDEPAEEMICLREIEAKECLVQHRDALAIPEAEDRVTRAQLEENRDELQRLKGRWT
jgi:hypothetical protein